MRPAIFLVMAAIFAAAFSLPAASQGRRAPGVQTLDQILPQIRRTHPGQFFDADGPTTAPDGSQHYHLKWMTPDGRIEWLDTDARTGRVLGASPGRDNFDGPGPVPVYPPAPSYPVPPVFGERFQGSDGGPGADRGYGGWRGGYPGGREGGYGGGRNYGGRDYGAAMVAAATVADARLGPASSRSLTEHACAFCWLKTTRICSGF